MRVKGTCSLEDDPYTVKGMCYIIRIWEAKKLFLGVDGVIHNREKLNCRVRATNYTFRDINLKTVENASYFDCNSKRWFGEDHHCAQFRSCLIPARKKSITGRRRSAGQSFPVAGDRG